MIRVIITVENEEGQPHDIEVPAELSVSELEKIISQALQWHENNDKQPLAHSLYAKPPGRYLHHQETLCEANVWDGAYIRFDTFLAAYFLSASGQCYPLSRLITILGRANDTIPDESYLNLNAEAMVQTVSRQHARVTFNKGQWQLSHLSQTNQTILENHVLTFDDHLTLSENCTILLGGVMLTFHFGRCL